MGNAITALTEIVSKIFRHITPGFLGLIAILLFLDAAVSHQLIYSMASSNILSIFQNNNLIIILLIISLTFMYVIGLFLDGVFHRIIEVPIFLKRLECKYPNWNLDAWGYRLETQEQQNEFDRLVREFYYYGEGFTKGGLIFILYFLYFILFFNINSAICTYGSRIMGVIGSLLISIGFLYFGYKYIEEFYSNFNAKFVKRA